MNKTIDFRSLLWVGTFLLISLSRLPAQQWQQIGALPAGQVSVLLVQGDTLFAAGLNKLYFTIDGGDTWDSTAVILPSLDYIEAVRYSQGRLYVGTVADGVYSSADGGQNWHADNNGLAGLGAKNISSFAIRGDSLYAGTFGSGVFVKKISSNSNWSTYNIGMPWLNIESLTHIDGRLFAGSGANATVSQQVSPGHAWVETPFAPFNGIPNSFLGVVRQGDVLLGAGSQGMYRSADEGATWEHFNPGTGLLGYARFTTAGNRVLVQLAKSTGLSFIKFTDDQGLSWTDFDPGLSGSFGYDLTFYAGRLYAARSNGLWRIELTTAAPEPIDKTATLEQNFPNPFSGRTTISFTLARAERVEIAVFDAAGAYIRTVWRGEKPAGSHRLELDAGDLPGGMYVYRLVADSNVAARWMTVLR